jgi:hypothetical protein
MLYTHHLDLSTSTSLETSPHIICLFTQAPLYIFTCLHIYYTNKKQTPLLDKPTSLYIHSSLPVWLTKKFPGIRPLSSLGSLDGLTPTTGKASLFGLLLLLVSPSLFSVRRGARVGWLIEASQ